MKGSNIKTIAKKDLASLASERTIVLAIALQLFVAIFSSFLMVGLTSIYDPSSLSHIGGVQYPVAYCGNDSPLRTYLNESTDFHLYQMDLSTAVAALKERKLSAVIFVSETLPNDKDPVKVTLYTIKNDIQASIVQVKLKDILISYETDLRRVRASRLDQTPVPLTMPHTRSGSTFYEFLYGLLIPLLVFMPAIVSAALVIDFITEEYQQGTLEVLLTTPVSRAEVVWGKVLACTVLVPVQAGAWLLLLMVNRIPILNAPLILIHATAYALVLILIAAFCALHYRERTAAQFIYSTAIVVLLLFSLAFPENPLNALVRLATGSAGPGQWVLLGLSLACIALMSTVLTWYAELAVGEAGGR
ncbi:MAG: ABC transporter permease [Methanomicrobiales archaeon]|nr:ABC transporter permease [Methanomicrobiales archaeon]